MATDPRGPHRASPAHRARRTATALSVGACLGLVGVMAASRSGATTTTPDPASSSPVPVVNPFGDDGNDPAPNWAPTPAPDQLPVFGGPSRTDTRSHGS